MAKIRFPDFWDIKHVKDIAFTTAGGTPFTGNRDFWGGNIPWMNSGELNLKTVRQVEGRITKKGLENSSTKLIPKHCVLIGLAGQGKTRGTVATNEIELCTNQSIAAIFPGGDFNHKYLYYNLELRYQELRDLSDGGGGRGGLNLTLINNLEIPLPKLSEQKVIAEALSDIDELIIQSKVLLDKKQKFLDGLLSKIFSGNIKFGDKKIDWKTTSFKEVSVIDWGNTNLTKKAYVDGGKYLAVSATGIDGFIDHYEHEAFVPVISAIGALCGKMLLPKNQFVAIKNTITVTPKKGVAEGRFLFYLLRYSELPIRGGAQPFISKGDIERFEALMPFGGDLEYQEQVLIADFLNTFEQEISDLKTELKKYEWLKLGMMNDLLTGKVRLV